jgi:excisionase family DNA binding protein
MMLDAPTDTKTKATDDLSWRVDSMCRQHPTQLWFAASPRDIATAKALCGNCTVRSACLEFALSRPELVGIWAATTPSERAVLRRSARTPEAAAPAPRGEADDDLAEPEPAREADDDGERDLERTPDEGWAGAWRPGEAGPPAPVTPPAPLADTPETGSGEGLPDELLTPAEAARRLGVTPNTVTRWSRAGRIAAIQTIGGHRRYRSSEIDRALRHCGPLQ